MDSFSLFDEKSLCYRILCLPFSEDENISQMPENFREKFEDITFPCYQLHELKQIERELQSNTDVVNVLDQFSFKFPFYPTFLETLRTDTNILETFPNLSANFILFSFLAWYSYFKKCHNSEFMIYILRSLHNLCTRKYFDSQQEQQFLAISAFYYSYDLLYENITLYRTYADFHVLIYPLCDYFHDLTQQGLLPQGSLNLIERAAYLIFEQNTSSITGTAAELLEFSTNLAQNLEYSFPYQTLLQKIALSIYNLDIFALKFFTTAIKYDQEDSIKVLFPPIVESILSHIDTQTVNIPDFNQDANNSNTFVEFKEIKQLTKFYQPITSSYDKEKNTQIQNLIHNVMKDIEIQPDLYDKYIEDNFKARLGMIIDAFSFSSNYSELLISIFTNRLLENTKNDKFYLQYYVFFYIAHQLALKQKFNIRSDVLCNDFIFSPKLSVFDSNLDQRNFQYYNIMRSHSIDMMFLRSENNIDTILSHFAQFPFLYSEVILRISTTQIYYDRLNLTRFICGFFDTYLNYRTVIENELSETEKESIKVAKMSVKCLISVLCRDEFGIRKYFNEYEFSSKFLSFFYEHETTQQNSLTILKFYLSKVETVPESFLRALEEFFDSLFNCNTSEFNWLHVAHEIINSINSRVAVSIDVAHQFTPITESLCRNLSKLPTNPQSVDVLMEVVSFLAFTSHGHSIQIKELIAVEAAINRLTHNNPTTEIREKLTQIIAGRPLSFSLPNFEIKQPKVLSLFVRVFYKSEKLPEILTFLTQLCSESYLNCKKCHEGDFDIFLIDLVDEWRDSGSQTTEIVDLTLKLLVTIVSDITSPIVVQRFIALLSPIDGVNLPYFHQNIITALNMILMHTLKVPGAFLNLDNCSVVKITGLKDSNFEKSFTFSFWMMFMHQHKAFKQSIFKVFDNDQHMLKISLKDSVLTTRVYEENQSYSGSFALNFEPQTWYQISVILDKVSDVQLGSTVSCYVNGVKVKHVSKFPTLKLKPGPVTVVVNEISRKYKNTVSYGIKLSTFSLYNTNMREDELAAMYSIGPRNAFSHSSRILFFEPQQSKGRFLFRTITINNDIKYTCQVKHIKVDLTFANLLVDACNVENVIPLFAQLDLKDKSGDSSKMLEEMSVDIIKNVLSLSDAAQTSFIDVGGFRAISYLLYSANQIHLSYPLYTRFFGLIQVLTNPTLVSELYDNIILNIDVWIRCSQKVHVRILKHWSRTVYQLEDNTPQKVRSFSWYCSVLRRYYWYKPVERSIIIEKRCNDEEFDVTDCRRQIYEIMNKYLFDGVSEHDLIEFLMNISTSVDEEQTRSLLSFIFELISSPDTPLYAKQIIYKNVDILVEMISDNQEIILSLINIFIELHSKVGDAEKSLPDFLFRILPHFKKKVASEELLNYFLTLVDERTEFLPLILWTCFNIPENQRDDAIKKVFTSLKIDRNYYYGDISIIYPVLICFVSDGATLMLVLSFIVSKFEQQWTEISFLINTFGRYFNMTEFSENIQNAYLRIMFNHLQNMANTQNYYSYLMTAFNLAFQFIFYRPIPQNDNVNFRNSALEEAYLNSPFNTLNKVPVHMYSKLSIAQGAENIGTILKETDEPMLYFGLRINSEGKWADESLVSRMVSFMTPKFANLIQAQIQSQSSSLNSSHNSNLAKIYLLLGYLLKDCPQIVEEFFAINPTFFDKEGISFIRSKLYSLGSAEKVKIPSSQMGVYEETVYGFMFLESKALEIEHVLNSRKQNEFQFSLETGSQIERLFSLRPKPKIKSSTEINVPYKDQRNERLQESEKTWIAMWRSMTLDRAPWNSAIPPSIRAARYKRDNCMCCGLYPMKLRKNFHFNDHKEASLIRDRGDTSIAMKEFHDQKEEEAQRTRFRSMSSVVDLPTFSFEKPQTQSGQSSYISKLSYKVVDSVPCEIISAKDSKKATVTLYSDKLVIERIIDNKSYTKEKQIKRIVLVKDDIQHVFYRTVRHNLTAIEIFKKGGRSYFIDFNKRATSFTAQLISTMGLQTNASHFYQNSDFITFFKGTGLTERWVRREISTFDYLILLNTFSGRSFNSPSQYPIFPWVIKNYDSNKLDIADSRSFRDFSKPVGAFDQSRLDDLIMKYEELESIGEAPYLYSSGYSYPLAVFLYMIRVEPFTTLHIEMQGGRFDHAARIFHSLKDTFTLVTGQQGDFRELIPEFFFMPEFLLNQNCFDLGKTGGKTVGDVELPGWARDCFEFVYINRKALESEYTSSNINKWIDLIWGYKQRGDEATKAYNTFKPQMYPEIWERDQRNRTCEERKIDIEMTLDQIGQIPQQLFTEPHPKRSVCTMKRRFSQQFVFDTKCAVDSSAISYNSTTDILDVCIVDKSHEWFLRYEVDISKFVNAVDDSLVISPKEKLKQQQSEKLLFLSQSHYVILTEDATQAKQITIRSGSHTMINSHTEISLCSIDGEWTVLACVDATLSINRGKSAPHIVRTYRNSITTIAVSAKFDQIIAGTKDNSLIFCSLSRSHIIKIVDLPKRTNAQSIIVTNSMGFVLVDGTFPKDGAIKHTFLLYNINGNFMREFTADFEVTCMATWSISGFDYMVVGDANGVIRICEVFFIDQGLTPCYDCKSKISSIKYSYEESVIIAVCANGQVFFIPFG